tara:strand:- start:277 stop:540 length:264 start_codon:yes stop_codon:yes gene_type:complete
MYKILNFFMIFVIIIFIFTVFKYYSSNKNMSIKKYNRQNIDQILKEKISDLPVLLNDTNNIIQFNDSFEDEIDDKKKRSFWNLLKNK